MPDVLSKQYTGLYHLAMVILSLAATILTAPQLVDLGWSWVATAAQAVTALGLLLQRFTPVGDVKAAQ